MENCTVETGLLRKKPCGHPSIAKCANCEQPLCSKHAIAQVSAAGRKTGKFLCELCNASEQLYQQTAPLAAPAAGKPAEPPKPAPPKAAAAKPPEPQKKSEPSIEDSGTLEFTPEPKKPDDKK